MGAGSCNASKAIVGRVHRAGLARRESGGQTDGGTGHDLLHGEQGKALKWLNESHMSCSSWLKKQRLLHLLQESRRHGKDGGENPISLPLAAASGTDPLEKCREAAGRK